MTLKTLPEQFSALIAGRYTGSPGVLWQQLERNWNSESVLDVIEDSRLAVQRDGTLDLTRSLYDAVAEALATRDHVWLMILCDQAEEAGVGGLCDLTRQALRVQYPTS